MAPRKKGPLQTARKETDDIKRRVDALAQDVNRLDIAERAETLQRCLDLHSTVTDTLRRIAKLTKADESAPIANYEQHKRDEEERLRSLQDRLKALAVQLQPRDRDAGPSSREGEESSEEEVSEEEDESQEEEEDSADDDDDVGDKNEDGAAGGEADQQSADKLRSGSYVAVSTFIGEEEGDLTVQKGTVLRILQKNEDGWWFAQDSQGNKGLVPRNYLKMMSPKEREQESEDESDKEQEDENDITEGKLSSSSHWDTTRKTISEIDATDVLSAMGAIPPGFRPSTLSKLLEEGTTYRASHYMQPKLSQSGLCFKDLQLDPDTGKVHARSARVCISLTLWSCRMIPPPGVGLQVLSRHVRLCAFNGTEVLSNIHTVRATYNPNNPKTWSFSPRMSSLLPCLLDGDCFFRCDLDSPDVGLLFELGITYIRNSTGEKGDLSCGWAFVKLFDENGALIPLRTQELIVHGGTPYEGEADATSTKRGSSTGVLQQMLMSRKQPRLIIKLKSPSSRTRDQLNLLPDTIVGCMSMIHLLALYRQLLADALLLDRVTMQNADLICNAVLGTFPEALDQSDLMDALRRSWVESENNLRRSDKRDITVVKKLFERVYMSSVFPLLYSAEMPAALWADESTETQRARLIYSPTQKITMETMLSPNHTHQAFDISQVTYDLLTSAWH